MRTCFWNSGTSTFYGSTGSNSNFTWSLRQGSAAGTTIASGSNKTDYYNFSNLVGGDYYVVMCNTGASTNASTATLCQDKCYNFKVVIKPNSKPSLGVDKTFCQNEVAYTLPYTPTGGNFTTNISTSLSNGVFTPSTAPLGASIIYYQVTNSNGCVNQDTAIMTVLSNPKPSIGNDLVMCSNAAPITVTPSISGGTFLAVTGLNTPSGVFTPSSSNLGVNRIVYTINNGNGCKNGDTAIYTVYSNPKPSIGADQSFCQFTTASYMVPNSPVGGSFKTPAGGSVTGLTGSSFNPTTAGVGASTVIYEVNNTNGCFNYDTAVYTTYANPKPSVGADQTFCSNAASYSIPNTPTGGSFNTVTGLSGNVFSPSAAAVGTSAIYYTVDNGNSCTNMDTVVMVVNSNPKPSIGSDQSFCQFTAANYSIPNSPVGGSFKTLAGGSVTGLTGSSFNPTIAGVGASTVIYEVNNSNGCLNYDTAAYTTYANPKPIVGTDQSFCSNAADYSIPNTPTGGSFNTVTGLSGNVFSPSAAAVGTTTIYYTVNNGNSCANMDTVVMVVNSNPKPSIGADQSFCQFTASNYTIPNSPVGGSFKTPAGGSVTGLTGSSFNPTTARVGASTVIYEVNNSNGCLNYDTAVYITYANPKPSVGADQSFCSNAAAYSIPNTPTGGSFNTVAGLTGNVFSPSAAAVGTSMIYYTVNNSNSCTNMDTVVIVVNSNPKPSIGADQSFCQFTTANYTIPNTPVGGTFKTPAGGSVIGLTGSTFNPTIAGVGASTVIYEVNNSNGCLNYDTAAYTTYANPKPSVGADQTFCSNAAAYSIPNTPTGGSFNTVTGLSGNVFTPSAAAVGTSMIYYTVNNGNSCTNMDTVVMVVNSNQKPSIGADQSFCQFTAASYIIPNSPVGGTFKTPAGGSVTGLTGSSFNTTTAGVGASTVIYEVNNSNGCLNYDTAVYTTYANPKPSVGADQSFCSNATAYSIPNTPTGGSFNTVTGLSGNVFSPSAAAVGTSAIYYTVNNGNGCNQHGHRSDGREFQSETEYRFRSIFLSIYCSELYDSKLSSRG